MNCFSRLFEFGYIDKDLRKDGIVQGREYYISLLITCFPETTTGWKAAFISFPTTPRSSIEGFYCITTINGRNLIYRRLENV